MCSKDNLASYQDIISASPLFHRMDESDLDSILSCLHARASEYSKDDIVFAAGNPAKFVGLVLEGSVQITRGDVFGNRTILAKLGTGELFGEVFACAGIETLPVSVMAAQPCNILLLDYRRIVTLCPSTCSFHTTLIENMLQILAKKNLYLNQKMEVLSAKGSREKLMTYLYSVASQSGGKQFQIPFNRQELADYLAVDRSALSRELGGLQRDGLIRFNRNVFELLE